MSKNNEDVLVVKTPIVIEAGKHTGIITGLDRPVISETRKFDYLDLSVQLTDVKEKPTLKSGYPAGVSVISALGKLLQKAGMKLTEGAEIKISDIKQLLMDREVTFTTDLEKVNDVDFARIDQNTIEFTG